MIKKISLAIILILIVCFQSLAIEIPKIDYFKDNIYVSTPGGRFYYNRDFSKNESFFKQYKKPIKILPNNLSILMYENDGLTPAVYIISKGILIGYCLLEFVELSNDPNNTLLLKPIKELKKDENYLKNDLKGFRGLEVVFYSNEKNNFVERYAFLKISNEKSRNILLMESFYPKNLENEIKPYIIKKLNYELSKFGRIYNLEKINNNHDGKDKSKDKSSGSRDNDKKIGILYH